MKNSLLISASAALVLLGAVPAAAQRHGKKSQRRPVAELKSDDLYKSLNDNMPDEFISDGKPTFAFASKNSKFVLSVGGFVKLTFGEDIGHPIESPDEFTTANIPMRHMQGNGAAFKMSAKQTQLYLNFVALPGSDNEVGAFVSANLLDDYVPQVQFAYLRYRGFQAGYDYTLFSDNAATAPSIDYEGPNALTALPTTGLRYGVSFGKKKDWKFSVGAELPLYSITGRPGFSTTVSQRVPDVPLALKYSWDGGQSWVRASGVIRNLYYRNEQTEKNVDKVGYGVQLNGMWTISPKVSFCAQGVYGKGIASYIQDCYGLGLDLCPTGEGGRMKAVEAWGAYGSLIYNITDDITCSGTYSHVRTYADPYSGGATAWADQYRYAQYVNGNIFWDVNSFFTVGLEYIWGRRANYDGMKCADNRLQGMVQLTF